MDLEQALARVAELEVERQAATQSQAALGERVTALEGERDGAVALGEQLRTQLGQVQRALSDANGAHVGALRRALLAENAGQVVPGLLAGETVEQIEASVEGAKAAFQRIVEATRAAIGAATVPTGAGSTRVADQAALEGASPLEKIAAGFNK